MLPMMSSSRKPFGKPFGQLRVVSVVESTHGPEPVEREGIHLNAGFRVKPGMTEVLFRKVLVQPI